MKKIAAVPDPESEKHIVPALLRGLKLLEKIAEHPEGAALCPRQQCRYRRTSRSCRGTER